MLPDVSALSTMAVLPRPWLCVAVVSPAACALWRMISPRMYDSVKRLEPTVSGAADAACVASARATNTTSARPIEAHMAGTHHPELRRPRPAVHATSGLIDRPPPAFLASTPGYPEEDAMKRLLLAGLVAGAMAIGANASLAGDR